MQAQSLYYFLAVVMVALGLLGTVLPAIPGLPPPADRLPPGCAFAPRCPLALEACRRGEIPLETIRPEQAARCIRAGEIARGLIGRHHEKAPHAGS